MRSPATRRSLLAALLALSAAGSTASAADFYWKGGDGIAATGGENGNWYTTAAGTEFAAAPDSSSANLFFNRTSANSVASTITVGASFSANSLTFNNTFATTLTQSGTFSMNLGAGGITLATGSGSVTIGNGNFLYTRLTANQGWTNNSTSILTVRSLSTTSSSGAVALTLNAANSGNIVFSQGIAESSGNPLSLVVNSAGSGSVNVITSSHTGGTTINRGHLLFNSSNNATGTFGAGNILLGNTSGSDNTTLTVRSLGFANNITVRSGSSGTRTLITHQTGGAVLNGTLTLDGSLAITSTSDGTFTNVISGTGNIVKTGTAALTFSGANTFSGNLTLSDGAFTLSGSHTFYLGADGISNQINGATAGAVAFNGSFIINLDDASLVDGNSWTLVSLGNTLESYGGSFSLVGFTESDNVWTSIDGSLTFTESDGRLTYTAVPEPSTFALLGGFGALCFASTRRRRRKSVDA